MKNNAKKILLSLVLLVGIFTLVGCGSKKADGKKESSAKSAFKNPKEVVALKGDKGTVKATYENDGTFEESSSGDSIILKNADGNFRFFFEFTKKSPSELEKMTENFKKSESWEVIDNVKFNGNKALVFTDVKYASTQVYIYLNNDNSKIVVVKISPVQSNKAAEEITNGKKAVDVIYNNEKVQKILNSITLAK